MDTTNIMQVLLDLGYEVSFRTDGWAECLVTRHSETWQGIGRDKQAAAENLFGRMFPSYAAKTLLERSLALSEVPVLHPQTDETARGLTTVSQPVESEPVVALVQEVEASEPSPAETLKPLAPLIRYEPDPRHSLRAKPLRELPIVLAPEPAREEEEPPMTSEDAVEVLDALTDEIVDESDAVATMSATYMRVQISSWILRARTIQEEFRFRETPREVEDRVHRIALRLTHLCKIYWPGNVIALNVYCYPVQCLEGIIPTSKQPATWAEASDILSAHMDETDGRRPPRDDQGWPDTALLRPEPPSPAAVVAEARALVEKVTGSLNGHLDELRGKVHADSIATSLEDLVLAAHLLRWTRKCCPVPETWGRVMGALRWCSREGRENARPLAEVLDENYLPLRKWAELLGRDPEINRRKRTQREVLEHLPEPGWLEENLLAWLRKAFSAFNNPQIAKMAEAVRDDILTLSKADFADADRSTRSRLHKLQSILRSGMAPKVDLPTEEELRISDESESAEDSDTETTDPGDRMLQQVCLVTKGKRILFVSNRDDVRLREELERDLECDVTLKNGGSPRLMRAIVDSIDASRYDIVCMATGFNNHSADANLCRKVKGAGLPYVRVQKGRRAATIRALGRAFNVLKEGAREDAGVSNAVH